GLPDKIVPVASGPAVPAEQVSTVSQDDKTFHPGHVAIPRGGRLWIVNNDTRTHNIRIFNPALDFDSGAQEPGDRADRLPARGLVPGILRHPSQDGTLRRRWPLKRALAAARNL